MNEPYHNSPKPARFIPKEPIDRGLQWDEEELRAAEKASEEFLRKVERERNLRLMGELISV